eukprot:g13104.t1
MDQNFNLRRKLYGDACLGSKNLEMIEICRRCNCAVKFPGSGGAVLGLCRSEDRDGSDPWHPIQEALEAENFVFCPLDLRCLVLWRFLVAALDLERELSKDDECHESTCGLEVGATDTSGVVGSMLIQALQRRGLRRDRVAGEPERAGRDREAELGCYDGSASQYFLNWEASGKDFFKDWTFVTEDPTNGEVNYLSRAEAEAQSLAVADQERTDHALLRVGELHNGKRNAVRIQTNKAWDPTKSFLVAMKYRHVPYGAGVWPAFWTMSSDNVWPKGGELDIAEFANDQPNLITLHVRGECAMDAERLKMCTPADYTWYDTVFTTCDTDYVMPPPSRRKEVAFEQPHEHGRRCVGALREKGCEFIIALTHLSLVNDKELAESCPGINVILGGHDHDPFFLVHRGVLIAKCGQNADHLGVLDLHLAFTGPNHSLQEGNAEHSFQFLNTSSASADPEVAKIVEKWNAQDGEDETVCSIKDVPLSSRTNELRTRNWAQNERAWHKAQTLHNSFGGLVADAMRWTFRHQGCQGAIINGGFVRHDRIYLPGPLTPGALGHRTRSQINEEMPFNKRIALQRLSGQQLRRGLEEMLRSTPTPVACFPQISEGMHLVYSPEAPAMEKIKSLKINGSEVDPQREIAVSEFYTLVAADGVTTFHDTPVLELYEGLIREAVVSYLHEKKELSGALPGRIVVAQKARGGQVAPQPIEAAPVLEEVSGVSSSAAMEEFTYESMVEYLGGQGVDLSQEGIWLGRIKCPCCGGGRTQELSFSVKMDRNRLFCKCWRANTCGRKFMFTDPASRTLWGPGSPAARATPDPMRVRQTYHHGASGAKKGKLGENLCDLTEEHEKFFADRKISRHTLDRNGVKSKKTQFGTAIVFQYFAEGQVVAEKMRALPKTFWSDAREVILTEGEIDKLAMDEAGLRHSASLQGGATGGLALGFGALAALRAAERVVLAVDGDPAGQDREECAKKTLIALQKELKREDRFYLAEAFRLRPWEDFKFHEIVEHIIEQGRQDPQEVDARLPNFNTTFDAPGVAVSSSPASTIAGAATRASSFNVVVPNVLAAFGSRRRNRTPLLGRLQETLEHLHKRVTGQLAHRQIYGASTGWKAFDQIWRPLPGEVTVATGIPGHGKSEFLLSLAMNMAHLHGDRTLVFAFESNFKNLAIQLDVKARATCPSLENDESQLKRVSGAHVIPPLVFQDADKALDWIEEHFIVHSEHEEALTLEPWFCLGLRVQLQSCYIMLKYVDTTIAQLYACRVWAWCGHSTDAEDSILQIGEDERKTAQEDQQEPEFEYIGRLMSELRCFAKENGLHVIIVAHPTKAGQWNGRKPSMYDIAGSANWFNKTDNGLMVYRQFVEDDDGEMVPTQRTEIHVQKVRNRDAGRLGQVVVTEQQASCDDDDVPSRHRRSIRQGPGPDVRRGMAGEGRPHGLHAAPLR